MSMIGLWNLARRDPDQIALVEHESGRRRTRGELAERTHQVVHALRELGLREGGVLAVVMANEIELLEVFFAALEAGWYIVPVNYHLTESEIEHILADSGAEFVFCSEPYAGKVASAAGAVGLSPERRIVNGRVEGFVAYEDLLSGVDASTPEDRKAGWMMTYTSGTTGHPKGIKRPLSGMDPDDVGEVWSLPLRIFGIGPEPHVHLVQSPFYHTAILVYVNASVQYGHRIVLMRSWDAERALEAIDHHRVTTTHMVPTHFHRLLQLEPSVHERYDVSSMEYAVHGAAPCPVETKQRMLDLWGPVIYEYYGASEGGGTVATPEAWLERPGTVGCAWVGAEVRILDADGSELPAGQTGEVWMKSGALDFEYHNSPEKTASSKRDGFFTVGDVGYLDADGYLFLQGRKSEIIITGGVNVHPSEIEAALHGHEAVVDVAAFGVPNPEWGEEVKAVVQPRESRAEDPHLVDELLAHCELQLARYKLPRSIDLVEELPRDPNGKLYKRRLQERYRSGASV